MEGMRNPKRLTRGLMVLLVVVAVGLAVWRWGTAPRTSGEQRAPGDPDAAERAGPGSGAGTVAANGHPQGPAQATPSAPPPSVLELSVVEAESSTPSRDVEVTVYWNDARELTEGGWQRAATAATDARGRVDVPVQPGMALVVARADAGALARRFVEIPTGGAHRQVTLRLSRSAAVEGRVTDARTGDGVAHAAIEVVPQLTGGRERSSLPEAERPSVTADARGNFSVRGVAPGMHRVRVTGDGYEAWEEPYFKLEPVTRLDVRLHGASFLTGRVVDATGAPVRGARVWPEGARAGEAAESGEGGGFSLEVGRGIYRVFARKDALAGALERQVAAGAGQTVKHLVITLSQGATLSGEVVSVDREGAPSSRPVAACGLLLMVGKERLESSCDQGGRFEWTGLPVGIGSLAVTSPGHAPAKVEHLALAAGERMRVRIEVSPDAAVAGRVTDPAGQPVPGALVRARLFGPQGGASSLAMTDAEGRFRIGDVPSGEVQVQATREGAAAGVEKRLQVAPGDQATVDLVLASSGTLTGRVTRQDGKPLRAATRVGLRSRTDRMQRASTGELDAQGRYRIELPEGEWTVNAAESGSAAWNFHTGARPVRILAGETAEQDLTIVEETPSCTGVVLEPGGAPATARVFLQGPQAGMGLSSNAEGRFSIAEMNGQRPDYDRAHAHRDGRYGMVRIGKRCDHLRIQLEPAAKVRGEVRDPSGKPVDGFVLEVSFGNGPLGSMWGTALTRRFGGARFQLDDVPGTAVRLTVRTEDRRQATAEVTLSPGADSTLDLEVLPAARIEGRLVSAQDGTPVVPAVVMLNSSSDRRSVDAQGAFRFDGLGAGDHELHIGADGFRGARRTLKLAPGEVAALGDVPLEVDRVDPGTIGATVGGRGDGAAFVHVKPKSPADAAGIREWDRILMIDGEPVIDMRDAAMRINGAPGSVLRLQLRRGDERLDVDVVRAP
jgi:protocatechuate 3,4-dioxygenase beta subunit